MIYQTLFVVALLLTLSNAGAKCTSYSRLEEGVCANACLKTFVGPCPVGLVATNGDLKKKSCEAQGYTFQNGTLTQTAGPCGKITFDLFTTGVEPEDNFIDLATFDGASDTTRVWETVNDPVMGGQSESTFTKKAENGLWQGEVKIVPSLQAPGFCTLRTETKQVFPPLKETSMIKLAALNAKSSALTLFTLQLQTESTSASDGTYVANITIPNSGEWVEVSANWEDFYLTYRGEPIEGPSLADQLDKITQIGMSTYFPGPAGIFAVELHNFRAALE